ncbi:MAG: hypothetical protein JW932_03885 [Deltaproteobacteria bacterium]|nr:hypothetical protein [Deltaproteobacteria bacterium]
MIVQIYEIQTPREAEQCIDAGVDHIGSVILSESDWHQPEIHDVISVSDGTPVKNSIIPLFQDIDTISRVIDYYNPDFIHFCETLTDDHGKKIDFGQLIDLQSEVKEKFPGVGIIRSIPIPSEKTALDFPSLLIANKFEPISDYFLTDTWLGNDPVKGFIGITGKLCDRNTAKQLVNQSRIPVILAGGLSPENVYKAVMDVYPSGADSCTLTNAVDERGCPVRFKKDFRRVRRFVEEVRRVQQDLMQKKTILIREIEELKESLRDREAALPAHSIRPHQILVIEELEEKITQKEEMLQRISTMIAC